MFKSVVTRWLQAFVICGMMLQFGGCLGSGLDREAFSEQVYDVSLGNLWQDLEGLFTIMS